MLSFFKRTIAFTLSGVLALSSMAFAASFSDVTEKDWGWAKSTIEKMSEQNIIKGFEDGTFRPALSITHVQALLLTSRISGVNDELNANYATASENIYGQALEYPDYRKELSYLLYKEILTENDLKQMLDNSKDKKPMTRAEVAVLLVKALGEEAQAKSSVMTVLSFDDSNDVPVEAAPYIKVAVSLGIMQGMGNNQFAPNAEVNRAQMALLLSRVQKILSDKQKVISGEITAIDVRNNTVSILDADSKTTTYNADLNTLYRLGGEAVMLSDFIAKTKALATVQGSRLAFLEALSIPKLETVTGIIKSVFSNDPKGLILEITVDGKTTEKKYFVDKNCTYTRGGESARLMLFQNGDTATLTIADEKVVQVDAQSKYKQSTGTIEEIVLAPDLAIKVRTSDNALATFKISSTCQVTKNEQTTDAKAISVGDTAVVVIEYDQVVRLQLTGVVKSQSGIITEINISNDPKITIRGSNNATMTFPIKRTANFTIDSKTGTIYDLRLGQQADLGLDSMTVSSIKASSTIQTVQITGEIVSINTSYSLINVKVVSDVAEENGRSAQIFFKSNTSVIRNKDNAALTVNQLKVGDTITAMGGTNAGAFEATAILIIK